jgi:hypothetical protein
MHEQTNTAGSISMDYFHGLRVPKSYLRQLQEKHDEQSQ